MSGRGTGKLARLVLRRDRIILPIWVLFFSLFPVSLASSIKNLYPTDADRQEYFANNASNAGYRALFGPAYSADLGALVAQRMTDVKVIIALISLLVVIRHTRTEEDARRRELLAATPVGRQAPVNAVLLVTVLANLVLGAVFAAGISGLGLAGGGTLALAFALAMSGILFAAAGALVAQVTSSARTARGIGILFLALCYLIRLVADAGGPDSGLAWLAWLSPFGWLQKVAPYTDDNWALFLLVIALAAAFALGAYTLNGRRDLGAGLLADRLGRAEGSPALGGPLALAWRMHRVALLGWAVAFGVAGAFFGGIADEAGQNAGDNETARDIIARMGGHESLSDSFMVSLTSLVGLVGAGYAVQTVLRMRAEETAGRVEPVLATSVSRLRYAASHLFFTLLGPAVALLLYGVVAGLAYGASTDDVGGELPAVLGGALVQLPAIWLVGAITVLAFGLLPRLSAAGWVALAVCFFFGQFGAILDLSQALLDISPFTHLPRLPGGDVDALPLVLLLAITAALAVAGLAGFRRRDIPAG
ncbi:ABC transporter permease [Phytohabitans suffuscus]